MEGDEEKHVPVKTGMGTAFPLAIPRLKLLIWITFMILD